MTKPTVAIILKGYPRLSETFIAQEIKALQNAGLRFVLISLRHPTDRMAHPVHQEIKAPVSYLPEYLHRELPRVFGGIMRIVQIPGFWRAAWQFLKDLTRDPTPNRIRRFGQAAVLAAELPDGVTHLYSHFLHTPSSVARYAAILTGCTWSFSAHARDIWTTPAWEKREKLEDALWGTTCTAYGHSHLQSLIPPEQRGRIHLSYHGIDLDRFPRRPQRRGGPDGSSRDNVVTIVSVGRAVDKKGYDTLLDAFALLPSGLHWRFVHIGGGELAATLKNQAGKLGIENRIEWRGPQAQSAVIDALNEGDLFVLACRIDRDGDRDGLPNVLLEALSQRLPCVSTTISAIPELIETEKTGLLVPPENPRELATAIGRLIENPKLRASLATAGRERLEADFTHGACMASLTRLFGLETQGRSLKNGEPPEIKPVKNMRRQKS